jgi:hypothetical protein
VAIALFYVLILHPLQEEEEEEILARLLVLLQDAITSNQIAVHMLMMVTIPLLYSYGFQNTWVISMGFLFFFHRIWCFGRSFTIWDQSSLMLLL